ncbi:MULTISPECIES: twin-arginine translocation signal domain-containing protein [Chelativorans]|uniref:Twin-arginine translocation pathway signal n=1 Tax=Chelativorans sp. (strain BNC1) TaxID=266779 RepID=Q11FJ3_CHESB|nr:MULTISPECIES: twin-arginine translocation signal domain-containing protein [Chelativorans]
MQDKRSRELSRRNFLRAFGGVSTTAVAAATLAPGEAHAYDPGEEETRARYRETDHIKAFYRVNSYPEKK